MKLQDQYHDLLKAALAQFNELHPQCQTVRDCTNQDSAKFLEFFANQVWAASQADTQRLCASWLSRRLRERTGSDRYDDEGALLRADLEKLRPNNNPVLPSSLD